VGRAVYREFAQLPAEQRAASSAHGLANALAHLLSALDGFATQTGEAGQAVIAAADFTVLIAALRDAIGYRLLQGDRDAAQAYRRLALALGAHAPGEGERR
jgi:hypothetical protein